MGGSPSKTRKLTVENDDPTSVIKVSDDVVDRIRGVAQAVRKQEVAVPQVTQITTPQPATSVLPVYLHEPSLTSIQIRQANVAELQKNDDYWNSRLKALEENHKRMNKVMEEEYNKALEEFKVGKPAQGLKEIPCLDMKKAVMECYRCNPDEPMRCSKIVQAFQECVDHKRSCLLASRVASQKG
ncbi:uncharacterized protein LOC143203828 [Rhynchophorus ferrugineus]|uniref:Uncharacterized protein n=1 Tax=Rhynchophorus ferrugineus TaxID=354439 RepID=A0A834INN1_RHYFE|nr:hypothetical protein GWI33_005067 [Rhynchophorus ferrugineus]